jgi:DNA-binding transcriptional LysR family regulator
MKNDPLETAELLAFARTVEAQSLTRAAAELGLPRATVGRRLQRMERRLGVRLLRRTTRRLALTDAGQQLYQHARSILDAVREAERSVARKDDRVRGRLRVSVPPIMPGTFGIVVSNLLAKYPDLRLDVHVSTRHVDLHAEGYDAALRAGGAPTGSGLVIRTLRRQSLIAVAAPSYLNKRGRPQTLRDLAEHDCLMGYARGELPQTHWPLLRGGSVHVDGILSCNDLLVLFEATRRGRGISMLPSLVIDKTLERGELEHVLPRVLGARSQLDLVYPERELMSPALRVFLDALIAWARDADCESERRAADSLRT